MPVHVLYDRDGYTSFEHLKPFLSEQAMWGATRIAGTRGMPHWEHLSATACALDYFWGTRRQEMTGAVTC